MGMKAKTAMVKGHQGESCAEAIRASIKTGDTLSFSEIVRRVRKRGEWKDETIWQHLMALVVNLPPARYHWRSAEPFLMVRPDGQYELHDPSRHPKVIE